MYIRVHFKLTKNKRERERERERGREGEREREEGKVYHLAYGITLLYMPFPETATIAIKTQLFKNPESRFYRLPNRTP